MVLLLKVDFAPVSVYRLQICVVAVVVASASASDLNLLNSCASLVLVVTNSIN